MSGQARTGRQVGSTDGESEKPEWATGGDSPAWSRRRERRESSARPVTRTVTEPYAELHCHTNFSFLRGASHPEELVEEGARLGLEALAVTDRNGFYGVVRFAEAARAVGLPTVFGAEVTVSPSPAEAGAPVVVLARGPGGYARLARALSTAQLAGEKGKPWITLESLGELCPRGGGGPGGGGGGVGGGGGAHRG